MVMKLPKGYGKRVAGFPFIANVVDDRRPGPAKDMINRGARVAMGTGFFTRPQHLDPARHRRQGRAAVQRIHIFQKYPVVRVSRFLSQSFERSLGFRPTITIAGRMNGIGFYPGRLEG